MLTQVDLAAAKSKNKQVILQRLEKALVLEFRASQALFTITKTERQLLVNRDFDHISRLIEQKEACLVELERLMNERQRLAQELLKCQTPETDRLPLDYFLSQIEPATSQHLFQLESGIQTLLEQTKMLIEGNQALAQAIQECSMNAPTSSPQIHGGQQGLVAHRILPSQV